MDFPILTWCGNLDNSNVLLEPLPICMGYLYPLHPLWRDCNFFPYLNYLSCLIYIKIWQILNSYTIQSLTISSYHTYCDENAWIQFWFVTKRTCGENDCDEIAHRVVTKNTRDEASVNRSVTIIYCHQNLWTATINWVDYYVDHWVSFS